MTVRMETIVAQISSTCVPLLVILWSPRPSISGKLTRVWVEMSSRVTPGHTTVTTGIRLRQMTRVWLEMSSRTTHHGSSLLDPSRCQYRYSPFLHSSMMYPVWPLFDVLPHGLATAVQWWSTAETLKFPSSRNTPKQSNKKQKYHVSIYQKPDYSSQKQPRTRS